MKTPSNISTRPTTIKYCIANCSRSLSPPKTLGEVDDIVQPFALALARQLYSLLSVRRRSKSSQREIPPCRLADIRIRRDDRDPTYEGKKSYFYGTVNLNPCFSFLHPQLTLYWGGKQFPLFHPGGQIRPASLCKPMNLSSLWQTTNMSKASAGAFAAPRYASGSVVNPQNEVCNPEFSRSTDFHPQRSPASFVFTRGSRVDDTCF